jgi:hypothetical protein
MENGAKTCARLTVDRIASSEVSVHVKNQDLPYVSRRIVPTSLFRFGRSTNSID